MQPQIVVPKNMSGVVMSKFKLYLTARTIGNPGPFMPHRLVFEWAGTPSLDECLAHARQQGLEPGEIRELERIY